MGLGIGLPYEYHVDEDQYVRQAANFGETGLEPAWWNNPPLFKYLLFVEFGFYYLLGKWLGWYPSPQAFGQALSFDPTLISPDDLNHYLITDDTDQAVKFITRFYRNFQSSRFVKDLFVIGSSTRRAIRPLPP